MYLVLHIQHFAGNLAIAKVFSKVDIVCSYCQIPVHRDNIPKTAVITSFGLWKFLHMPFVLQSVAQAFQ